jgi:ubiquinone/menaquinone biosynthesis C-methylase UbiE
MHFHRNIPVAFEGRHSRMYDVVARRPLRRLYAGLAEDIAAEAPPGGTVVDIGTGPGVLLVELGHRRPDLRLIGIDLSADMIAAARRNLAGFDERASALVGDVADLPLPDASVDLVVSTLSSHHWDHPEAAIGELARVIKPGGRVEVYDVRIAPFDVLEAEARRRRLFTGAPPSSTPFRTRPSIFPNYRKLVLTAA